MSDYTRYLLNSAGIKAIDATGHPDALVQALQGFQHHVRMDISPFFHNLDQILTQMSTIPSMHPTIDSTAIVIDDDVKALPEPKEGEP